MKENQTNKLSLFLSGFFRVIVPLLYVYCWYAIPALIFGKDKVDPLTLTLTALPVMFIGVISRQTTWSIGGDKGIKGDNIGKKVQATIDRKGSFNLQGVEMNEYMIKSVIESVEHNPIFTNKARHEG